MKKISFIIFAAVSALTLCNCDGMMDVHEEYVKDGEIIYAPKIDSLSFIAGRNRAQFNYWLYNAPNVKSVDVFWNGRADSLIIPVSPSSERDSFTTLINNLPEQSYTFEVRTTDNYGHNSLWTTAFGNTYDADYVNTLSNRRVKSLTLDEYGGVVNWLAAADGLVRMEVRYTANNGSQLVTLTPSGSNVSALPDAKAGTQISCRSVFIPETESIDTFFLDWVQVDETLPTEFSYDRSLWSVLACSDETASDGGGMHTILDGDYGTYWHSQWDGGNVPLPHWLLVDLSKQIAVSRLMFVRRNNSTDDKDVLFFLGNTPDADADDWVQIGAAVITQNETSITSTNKTFKGRYLKLLFTTGNREPFTNCAEIYLYGGE